MCRLDGGEQKSETRERKGRVLMVELGRVVRACDFRTQEVKAGGLKVSQPG